MTDEREFEESLIDWDEVRGRVADRQPRVSEEAIRYRRDWVSDVIETLRDLTERNPHRRDDTTVSEDDIDFALEANQLIMFSYQVRLGNRVTGAELTFPQAVQALSEDQAGLLALERFRTEDQFAGLRGDEPADWAVYGVD